jgi:hypothetical protein
VHTPPARRRWYAHPHSARWYAVDLTTGDLAYGTRRGHIPRSRLGLLSSTACERIVQRSVFDSTGPATRRFARTAVEGRLDRGEFFVTEGLRLAAPFPPALGSRHPALIRSCVKARSYWASVPNTLKRKASWGVVVSICAVSERKAIPCAPLALSASLNL